LSVALRKTFFICLSAAKCHFPAKFDFRRIQLENNLTSRYIAVQQDFPLVNTAGRCLLPASHNFPLDFAHRLPNNTYFMPGWSLLIFNDDLDSILPGGGGS
jgi:hypothetical protein